MVGLRHSACHTVSDSAVEAGTATESQARSGWVTWRQDPCQVSTISLMKGMLPASTASEYLLLGCYEVAWHLPRTSKGHSWSRELACFTREGSQCKRTRAGYDVPAQPFPSWLDELWHRLVASGPPAGTAKALPDTALLERYRNAKDHKDWHTYLTAAQRSAKAPATTVMVALGSPRKYQMKFGTASVGNLALGHGDAVVLTLGQQGHIQHRVLSQRPSEWPREKPRLTSALAGQHIQISFAWVDRHASTAGGAADVAEHPDPLGTTSRELHLDMDSDVMGADTASESDPLLARPAAEVQVLDVPAPCALRCTGFIGHDMSQKSRTALRVIACQGQSRLACPDSLQAADRFAQYLRSVGADLALVSETGLRDGSPALRRFEQRLRQKHHLILLNHYPADLPHNKGVCIISRTSTPPRAKSVRRDNLGRAMAASFAVAAPSLGQEQAAVASTVIRVVSAYGVQGGTRAGHLGSDT